MSICFHFGSILAPCGTRGHSKVRLFAFRGALARTFAHSARAGASLSEFGCPRAGPKAGHRHKASALDARENCTLAPLAVLPLGFQHILRFYRRVLPVKQLTKVSCSKLRFSRSFTESVQELVIVQWMCRRVTSKNSDPTRRRSCDFTARRISLATASCRRPWTPRFLGFFGCLIFLAGFWAPGGVPMARSRNSGPDGLRESPR